MSRRAYSPVALAAVMVISACAGKPVDGPTSGPVLSQTGSSSPVSSVSSSTPPPPPTWKLGTPPASTPTSILRDVAATDATHGWAVGSDAYTPTEQYTTGVPLVVQWDGRQWTRMPLPDVTWKGGLNLVAAGSPTDLWAVGGPMSHDLSDNITKVLRFDGTAWREVPFPPGATPSMITITDLSVVAGHAWLVGHKGTEVVVQEWTGQSWREHQAPAECVRGGSSFGGMPNFCNFTGVKAFAPDDVWACGNGAWAGFLGPLLYHWNGTDWRVVQVAGLNEKKLALESIDGRSASDLWAVGDMAMQGGDPLAIHGDGTTWQVVEGLPQASDLRGLAVDSAGNPWLIKNFTAPSATLSTYRTPGSWADTPAPTPPDAVGIRLNAITAVPGTNQMLAVGAADLPTQPRLLQAVILEYS